MDLTEIKEQIRELQEGLEGVSHVMQDADGNVFLSGAYESVSDLFLASFELDNEQDSQIQAREYLVRAIEACRTGAMMAPADHDQKGNFWARAAQLSSSAFEIFGEEQDITSAIEYCDQALRFLHSGSEEYASVLATQANYYTLRFERAKSADVADLTTAISKAELARGMLSRAGSSALLSNVKRFVHDVS